MNAPVAHAERAHILDALRCLVLGAVARLSGIAVRRASLLTYTVGGLALDLEEVPAELEYLVAERDAVREEPTLLAVAEVVERQLFTGARRLAGRFSVTVGHGPVGPLYTARWSGHDWQETAAEQRLALDDLVASAQRMGLRASRVGYEVIATLPASPASAPAATPAEFLSARETFVGAWTERWEKGPVADRRVRQLRDAFGRSVATRSTTNTQKLWSEPGADRRSVDITEITFIVPRGKPIPAPTPAPTGLNLRKVA